MSNSRTVKESNSQTGPLSNCQTVSTIEIAGSSVCFPEFYPNGKMVRNAGKQAAVPCVGFFVSSFQYALENHTAAAVLPAEAVLS